MQTRFAYLLARVMPREEAKALSTLKKIELVEYAHLLYGKYDLLAKVSFKNLSELDDLIFKEVKNIPNIELKKTMISA